MENPFELPIPDKPLERAKEYIRDIAFGITEGHIEASLDPPLYVRDTPHSKEEINFRHKLRLKWEDVPLESMRMLMETFGYITITKNSSGDRQLRLTEKAFDLLEKPASPPDVFISYKRTESSAFALLVEARLKNLGNPNPFVDKNMRGGEKWEERIQNEIKTCRYFVVLIGEKTLESKNVWNEIRWALAIDNCEIIPILHNGFIEELLPEELRVFNAIRVREEDTSSYETATNQMLNSMGYATY